MKEQKIIIWAHNVEGGSNLFFIECLYINLTKKYKPMICRKHLASCYVVTLFLVLTDHEFGSPLPTREAHSAYTRICDHIPYMGIHDSVSRNNNPSHSRKKRDDFLYSCTNEFDVVQT